MLDAYLVDDHTESRLSPNNSDTDTQIKNDKIIASEWQKDMFDFENITLGRVHINQIITKGNNNNNIQIQNNEVIPMNVSDIQNEIYQFTEEKLDKID